MRSWMPIVILLLVILATSAWMVLDSTHVSPPEAARTELVSPVAIAPDVTFTLLNGKPLKLHALQGREIWLHFWASWCAPCKQEFGSLLQHLAKRRGKTVLLAVSGDTNAQDIESFLYPFRRDFPALFDSNDLLIASDPTHTIIEGVFQTFKYPETIVLGPDLTMRRKIVGIFTPEEP